jgi:hypothetical protein
VSFAAKKHQKEETSLAISEGPMIVVSLTCVVAVLMQLFITVIKYQSKWVFNHQ